MWPAGPILKHKHTHLLQAQIYAARDSSLKGDVIVISVTAGSSVNILPLLLAYLIRASGKCVCFPFQFYQEELGQERLRIEQEMEVGFEFGSTSLLGAVLEPSTECQDSITDLSLNLLLMQRNSNTIHI